LTKKEAKGLEEAPEETLDEVIQRILTEEYVDAFQSIVSLMSTIEQQKDRVDKVEWRLKDLESIKNKMKQKGIGISQLREQIKDIIGIRIVVHFLSDIPLVIEMLRSLPGLEFGEVFEDYITTPQATGYRSLHIDALYRFVEGMREIPSEIQIRTTLQHAWATKSHLLAYKIAFLPQRWQRHFRILSDQLYLADEVARNEVEGRSDLFRVIA